MPRPLAVSFGEPSGIGPDITLMAWMRRAEWTLPTFHVLADPDYLRARARLLGFDVPVEVVTPDGTNAVFGHALPVVDCGRRVTARPGEPEDESARAAIASIDLAIAQVLAGEARALVTNPIAKAAAYRVGFSAPGHTEHLAERAREAGHRAFPVMMLWSPGLAVVPVTIHVPLARVPGLLTQDLVVETGRIVARELQTRFGVARPRLAVSGLNPHAGEQGTIGSEEKRVIAPAIEILRREGVDVRGPLPADTMFHAAARASYDAALMMYHDQALIPIKALAFDEAVNVTLGLPFVRTSPDHGTAFALAGTGRANPTSLVAALKLAARLAPA